MTTTNLPATELTTEELQLRAAALRQELANLNAVLAEREVHMLVTSKPSKPVRLCREVFVKTYNLLGVEMKRADVIDRLVKMGVAPNTAKTQYGLLKGRLDKGKLNLTEFDREGEEGDDPSDPAGPDGSEPEGSEDPQVFDHPDMDAHERYCDDLAAAAFEEQAYGRD